MSTKKKTLSIFDTAIVGNPLSERKKGNIFDKNTSNFSTDGLRQILGFVHSPEHIREPEEYQVSDLAKQKLNRISGGVFGFPYRQVDTDLRSPVSSFELKETDYNSENYLQEKEYVFTASFDLDNFVNIEKFVSNYFYRNYTNDLEHDYSNKEYYTEITDSERIDLRQVGEAISARLTELAEAEDGSFERAAVSVVVPPGWFFAITYGNYLGDPGVEYIPETDVPERSARDLSLRPGFIINPPSSLPILENIENVFNLELNRDLYIVYGQLTARALNPDYDSSLSELRDIARENPEHPRASEYFNFIDNRLLRERIFSINNVSEERSYSLENRFAVFDITPSSTAAKRGSADIPPAAEFDGAAARERMRGLPDAALPAGVSSREALLGVTERGVDAGPLTLEQALREAGYSLGEVLEFNAPKLIAAYNNFVQFLRGNFSFDRYNLNGELEQISFSTLRTIQAPPSFFNSLLERRNSTEILEFLSLDNIINPVVFYDHRTDIDLPLTLAETAELNGSVAYPYFDVHNQYNFFIDDYERSSGIAFASSEYEETKLPNFYIMNGVDNESVNNFLSNHEIVANSLYPGRLSEDETEDFRQQKEFFSNYAYEVKEGLTERQSELDAFGSAQKTIYLDKKFDNLYNEYKNKLNYVPFFNKIGFSTGVPSSLSMNLASSAVEKETLKSFSKNFNLSNTSRSSTEYDFTFQEKSVNSSIDIDTRRNRDVQILDVVDFLNSLSRAEVKIDQEDSFYEFNSVLNENQRDIRQKQLLNFNTETESEINSEFVKAINVVGIANKIRTFSQDRRKLQEVLRGDLAKNEVLCYSIEKKALSTRQSDIIEENIQEIFVFNNLSDVYDFVDTQVKYSKRYTYNLNAFVMIIGNEYYYNSLQVSTLDGLLSRIVGGDIGSLLLAENTEPKAEVRGAIRERASVKIAKIRISARDNLIIDSPPLAPNAYFFPVRDNPSVMKIAFTPCAGDAVLPPVSILPSDDAYFRAVISSQQKRIDLPPNDKRLVRFKKDDIPSFYQILRIPFRPSSYSDFSRSQARLESTALGGKRADSITFLDRLTPNQDYYYTFRTIDVHGSVSNPTPVFRVRNVLEDGTYIPIIEEYLFENNTLIPNKKFRRFLKIEPTVRQAFLSDEQFNNVDKIENVEARNLQLGLEEDSVFGKTFRAKVTSTKTGKKIFIDFKFDLNKNELFSYIRNKTR